MSQQARVSLASGLVLILLGGYFLLSNLYPGLPKLLPTAFTWPWIVVAVGGGLLVIGMLVGAPDMAVPACIVAGIGGILMYQNTTGNWASWSYAWTLIPGFAGVGTVLSGLIKGSRKDMQEGLKLVLISGVMFVIFSALFGGPALLGQWWPAVLILLGIFVILSPRLPR